MVDRILELRRSGASYRSVVATLEAEGHPTKRGGRWHAASVRHVVNRATRSEAEGA